MVGVLRIEDVEGGGGCDVQVGGWYRCQDWKVRVRYYLSQTSLASKYT